MIDTLQADAIFSAGIKLLKENLGLIETELFISYLKKEQFDYTEWSQNLYNNMTADELTAAAIKFAKENPQLVPENARVI